MRTKTPLLGALRSLFRDVQIASVRGVSVGALREFRAMHAEQTRQRGVSRRTFLATAGATAAAMAVPRFSLAAPAPTVVIVGGGIAGLNCALELADAGIRSTVYEASGRIGGRMFSNNSYWAANQVTEWCGELIDTSHTTVRKLARRFDLGLDNLLGAQPPRSDDIYYFSGQYYAKNQADRDFGAVAGIIAENAEAAGFPTTFDSNTAAGRALDRMSVYEYIERRIPGGHRSPLGALLDVAYAIEYGADSTDQSALNLIFLLGFQPNASSLAIYGESDEKFHIRDGNQQLPEAIARFLGADAVRMGHRLTRVAETTNGRYKVAFERAGGVTEVTADFVVLALPFAVLNELDISRAGFDSLKHQAIAEQGRGHNGKLHLQYAERGWLGKGQWPGVSNGSSYCRHRLPGDMGGDPRASRHARNPGLLLGRIDHRRRRHRHGVRHGEQWRRSNRCRHCAISDCGGISRTVLEWEDDTVASSQESLLRRLVLLLPDGAIYELRRVRAGASGRSAVLR
jgi:monoamine oxidase